MMCNLCCFLGYSDGHAICLICETHMHYTLTRKQRRLLFADAIIDSLQVYYCSTHP